MVIICAANLAYGLDPWTYPQSAIPEFRLPKIPYLKSTDSGHTLCHSAPRIIDIPIVESSIDPPVVTVTRQEEGLWSDGNNKIRALEQHFPEPESLNWLDHTTGECEVLILNPTPDQAEAPLSRNHSRENKTLAHPYPAKGLSAIFSNINTDEFQTDYIQVSNASAIIYDHGGEQQKLNSNTVTLLRWQESDAILALYANNGVPGLIVYEDHIFNTDLPEINALVRPWHYAQLSIHEEDLTWQIDDQKDPYFSYLRQVLGSSWVIYRYTDNQGRVVYVLINAAGVHYSISQDQLMSRLSMFYQNMLEILLPEYFGGPLPAGGGIPSETWQAEHRLVPDAVLYRLARIVSEYGFGKPFISDITEYPVRKTPRVSEQKKGSPKKVKKKNEENPGAYNPVADTSSPNAVAENRAEATPSTSRIEQTPRKNKLQHLSIKNVSELTDMIETLKHSTFSVWRHMLSEKPQDTIEHMFCQTNLALCSAASIASLKNIKRIFGYDGKTLGNFVESKIRKMRQSKYINYIEVTQSEKTFEELLEPVLKDIVSPDVRSAAIGAFHSEVLPRSILLPLDENVRDLIKECGESFVLPYLTVVSKGLSFLAKNYHNYLTVIKDVPESHHGRIKVKHTAAMVLLLAFMSDDHFFLCKPQFVEPLTSDGIDCRLEIAIPFAELLSLCGHICSGRRAKLQFEFSDSDGPPFESSLSEVIQPQLVEKHPLIRSVLLAGVFCGYWQEVISKMITEQKLTGKNAAIIVTGLLGCIEIYSAGNEQRIADDIFTQLHHCKQIGPSLIELLTTDDKLRSRLVEAMEFYSQYLEKVVAADKCIPDEPKSKYTQVAYLQIKNIASFLETIRTPFTGKNRARLDEIISKLNRNYQETVSQRESVSLDLKEKEDEELKQKKEKDEAFRLVGERAQRQKIYKAYIERKRKEACKEETEQGLESTCIEPAESSNWQLIMEEAAKLLTEGSFSKAVDTISEPAYNEDDATLRFMSLSELALIHIQRLGAITRPLTSARRRMDRFESIVANINRSTLEELIRKHDISVSNTPEILKLITDEDIKIYDRESRFVYYDDVQEFIRIIIANKESIEELASMISNLLDSFHAFTTFEKPNIEEETLQAMTPIMLEAIDVYKADTEWLEGRTQRMAEVLDKVKEINKLIGIYGHQESTYGLKSEPTLINKICAELKFKITVYKDIFDKLQLFLNKR